MHQADGFTERGVSITVGWNPTLSTPLGFSARVTPFWGGNARNGSDAIWSQDAIGAMGHHATAGGSRLDADLGYGLPVGARFVGKSTVGFGSSEYGRRYRTGYRVQILEKTKLQLELGIDPERMDRRAFAADGSPKAGGANKRVSGPASVQW